MGSWLGGHKYKYVPDNTANNAAAERARLEWSRYQSAYAPLAQQMTGELAAGGQGDITQAQGTAEGLQTNANEAMTRKISQYGLQLSPMQREALASKFAANKSLGGVTAANTERRAVDDRNDIVREGLVGLGTGIRNMADTSMSSAANLEQQRNATGYQIAQNKTAASQGRVQQAIGLGGQAIGTGAAIFALS
jgi:hypothetical protein